MVRHATWLQLVLLAAALVGCTPPRDGQLDGDAGAGDAGVSDAGADLGREDGAAPDPAVDPTLRAGRKLWDSTVQPLIRAQCAPCHVGPRFAFASLTCGGDLCTAAETERNYESFFNLISLDSPTQSRLLAKILSETDPAGVFHAGGAVAQVGDATYTALLEWIRLEKSDRCPHCGVSAPVQYLAYVEQPNLFWALNPDPVRRDHGLRDRARIMLQPLAPGTLEPVGSPIDFLGDSFCGADGRCDFGQLAASHAGDRLAFECRLSMTQADWVDEVRWNVCIAEIGPDGRAQNPRFLMPPLRQQRGSWVVRSDPFGLTSDGHPLVGPYDLHFQTRRGEDRQPTFSPDDGRIYVSSRNVDPRTGIRAVSTYHGSSILNHIVAVRLDGSDARTIYTNEGGEASFPFFLQNGNLAVHTWNLERLDRHLYTQMTADGMMEVPVLFGRLQGPNMWGKAVQLANGGILGATGRRRSAIELYVLFFGDHTLGTGIDPEIPSLRILDQPVFEQVLDFPNGYCGSPEGTSCFVDRIYLDPAYSPDGRAFIAHNPEKTYVLQGEEMYLMYATGATDDERVESLRAYVPKHLGIWSIDHHGDVRQVVAPRDGFANRYPTWVGRRQPPRSQQWLTDEAQRSADLHIANVPVWLSFTVNDQRKSDIMQTLDTIVSLRVLEKVMEDNACENDGRPYRYAVNNGVHDHPTHLGINNATGYVRLSVPASAGGDGYGDVPLRADGSVRVRVPAGTPLLFQGVNALGHVVMQRSRLLTLPPGQTVDTSVRREHYQAQCMPCHGTIASDASFSSLTEPGGPPAGAFDYRTLAAAASAVDLTSGLVQRQPMTFLQSIRPLLDRSCISCHAGASPAGELSLESSYSPTGNFPAGRWATTPGMADPAYVASVPPDKRVPAYNYSVTYAWNFRDDDDRYKQTQYGPSSDPYAPLGALAPWDPGYQNLFTNDNVSFTYLSGFFNSNFGRSDRVGGLSSDSWLIEILTGRDLDPRHTFSGPDHTSYLSATELRTLMGVIDVGFPYMTKCSDRTVPAGPNATLPWGDPEASLSP